MDKGFTFVVGRKLSKDDHKLEVLGELDELSSFLGLAASFVEEQRVKTDILFIQKKIFEIGQDLLFSKSSFKKEEVELLEGKADDYSAKLPKVSSFVLPGGEKQACLLHVCRSVARRGERRLVSLSKKQKVNPATLAFLNRLSSFLYVLARFANFKKGRKEIFWP